MHAHIWHPARKSCCARAEKITCACIRAVVVLVLNFKSSVRRWRGVPLPGMQVRVPKSALSIGQANPARLPARCLRLNAPNSRRRDSAQTKRASNRSFFLPASPKLIHARGSVVFAQYERFGGRAVAAFADSYVFARRAWCLSFSQQNSGWQIHHVGRV